jgi:gamma-glutamylputrescine oxidase
MNHVESYYAATANPYPACPPLTEALEADVCVIGGGYTGISSALHLAERGYRVVLLEAARIGWGASGRNGGELFNGQRRGQDVLEKWFGMETARRLWDLGLEAVSLVVDRVRRHGIACDLKPGIVTVAAKRGQAANQVRTAERLQKSYGYDRIRVLDREATERMIGTDRYHGGLLDEGCWHLHPLNLALGLADAALQAGAQLFEQSRVVSVRHGEIVEVNTAQGRVRARYAVLACNAYLGGIEPRIAGKALPINNYMLATEPFSDAARRALIAGDVAVCDTKFVVNYWRFSADGRLLFGGGENYTRNYPEDIRGFVRRFLLRIYPQLAGVRIDYGWGGTLAVTMRRLPHIGRLPPNVYFAQGYSGHGIGTANLAGKLIAEALAGSAGRFDVMARLPTHTFPGGTLLRYPLMVLGMLYYALLDRL